MIKQKYLHRYTSYNKNYKKYCRKKYIFDDLEELPFRVSFKRKKWRDNYSNNYDFTPLVKYLETKINCDFDDVYKDIISKTKNRFYRYHIDYYIDLFYRVTYDNNYIPLRFGRLPISDIFIDINNIVKLYNSKSEIINESNKLLRKEKLLKLMELEDELEDESNV